MAAVTDEQFFFAIIKQLDGSIDWQKVADECGIVTKGAAAKRFSRLKVKYGKGENGTEAATPTEGGTPATDSKKGKRKTPVKSTPRKKRKVEEQHEEAEDHEDEATETKVKAEEADEA